jgi:hypothetical protein
MGFAGGLIQVERFLVTIRKPPEVMRGSLWVDHRELRMAEAFETLGPELSSHAGLLAAAVRSGVIVQ